MHTYDGENAWLSLGESDCSPATLQVGSDRDQRAQVVVERQFEVVTAVEVTVRIDHTGTLAQRRPRCELPV
jgi:hypothetical protein